MALRVLIYETRLAISNLGKLWEPYNMKKQDDIGKRGLQAWSLLTIQLYGGLRFCF